MPWVFLGLAIAASIWSAIDSNWHVKFGDDTKNLWGILIPIIIWKTFTPALLFVLAAVTWLLGK
jgi:hypothetical protein